MKIKTLAVIIVLVCFTAIAAMAENPHFIKSDASVQSDGTLLVTWKEAGLGNQVITYKLTATAQVTYGCVVPGQHPPLASSKITVTAVVTTMSAFTASRNGSITGSMVLTPPSSGAFTCPSGQVVTMGSVVFTSVDMWDMIMHVEENMGGPYARVIVPF
jgi:hypothetical protein